MTKESIYGLTIDQLTDWFLGTWTKEISCTTGVGMAI